MSIRRDPRITIQPVGDFPRCNLDTSGVPMRIIESIQALFGLLSCPQKSRQEIQNLDIELQELKDELMPMGCDGLFVGRLLRILIRIYLCPRRNRYEDEVDVTVFEFF